MYRALVPLLALCAVLTATLAPDARSGPAAPAGPGAVVAMHVQLFAALDSGDAARAASFVVPDQEASLLLDRGGQPELVLGRARVAERLAEWARSSGGAGATTAVEVLRADCPSGALSYAVLEIERSRETAAGGEVRRYVSPSLVQHRDGGWKLMHWHLSPAESAAPKKAGKQ